MVLSGRCGVVGTVDVTVPSYNQKRVTARHFSTLPVLYEFPE